MLLESFDDAVHRMRKSILDGVMLDRGEWQGKTDKPFSRVLETYNFTFQVPLPITWQEWRDRVSPNMPWAEDHFQERVGGEPLNPGKEFKNWPWYEQGVEDHRTGKKFSHTYMERFWPRFANNSVVNFGIREAFGDLNDLVTILIERPLTRQAYLPIWFPEDLSLSSHSERVPCTLGYHFLRRPHADIDSLDITYFMRSCDFFRYLRDDAYMAGRLLQWVVDRVEGVEEGTLTMHIVNLHVFADERVRLEKEHNEETQRRLSGAFR